MIASVCFDHSLKFSLQKPQEMGPEEVLSPLVDRDSVTGLCHHTIS